MKDLSGAGKGVVNGVNETSQRRFKVALSFAGDERSFVSLVASRLASGIGRDRVLYDGYYEAEFARPDLDTYLQRLYHDESDLVVVFLCAEYECKDWCGLEWRVVRDLIKRRRTSDIMLLRFDDTEIPGLFSIDGVVSINARSPAEIAELILERLRINIGSASAVGGPISTTDASTWANRQAGLEDLLASVWGVLLGVGPDEEMVTNGGVQFDWLRPRLPADVAAAISRDRTTTLGKIAAACSLGVSTMAWAVSTNVCLKTDWNRIRPTTKKKLWDIVQERGTSPLVLPPLSAEDLRSAAIRWDAADSLYLMSKKKVLEECAADGLDLRKRILNVSVGKGARGQILVFPSTTWIFQRCAPRLLDLLTARVEFDLGVVFVCRGLPGSCDLPEIRGRASSEYRLLLDTIYAAAYRVSKESGFLLAVQADLEPFRSAWNLLYMGIESRVCSTDVIAAVKAILT